jgi:signal transduction histidine kinase/PAS domain-containing protein/ActR/RegA family two-component response regulator
MSETEILQHKQELADERRGRGRGAAARRDRFMLALNDRLQPLSDPLAIQREACRVLGEHLGCDWAHFLEFDEDAAYALARSDYRSEGAASLLGRHSMAELGPMREELKAGHTLSERDLALSDIGAAQSRATYVALGLRAFAMAPIVRRGHLTAALVVCFRAPRDWTRHELQLIEETAARTADAAERAGAERKLRESESRLQLALDASGIGTFTWRLPEDRFEADPRLLSLFGLTPSLGLTSRQVLRVIHPDDRRRWMEVVTRALEAGSGGSLRDEIRILLPDGSERWLSIIAEVAVERDYGPHSPAGPESSVTSQLSGIAANITDRKRRERNRALIEGIANNLSHATSVQEILEVIGQRMCGHLNTASSYLLNVDESNNTVRADFIWRRDGVAIDQEVGLISDFVSEEFVHAARTNETIIIRDTATDRRTNEEAYAALDVHSFIAVPFIRAGEWRFVYAVCDYRPREWREDEIDIVREMANRLVPRLERIRAEQAAARSSDALRESEHRLSEELADTKLLQELSAQLIGGQESEALYDTLVEAAMSIMDSSCGALQVLHPERGPGGSLRLIASRGFSDEAVRFWKWVRADSATTCAKALRSGARVVVPDVTQCDFMAGTPDLEGYLSIGIHAAQTTPLVSRGGKVIGMISTHWNEEHHPSERDFRLLDILARQAADLMERSQAEETLRRNERELKEADRRKDEFLATLAHELRNPLAPLRTSLELIRLAGDTPGAVEDVRSMMEEQLAQLVRLVDDLLDVSRITSGKVRLHRQPTSLVTLVNAAVHANQAALNAGRVSLHLAMPNVPVLLDADPTRFVQVLSNVLHNAVKFTDAGGHITVSAAVSGADGDASRDVALVVADTGVGITKEMLPRVFERFTQDDTAVNRAQTGLGIGLALARQLIELHGGTIEARSDGPGRGSMFTIRMPVHDGVVEQRTATPPVEVPRTSRRVVVIDDNPAAANAMQRLVNVLGGQCRVAYDGESGLTHVREFQPDIVILDIGMPGIDGYETCRRIRAEFGPQLLVVALTGWGQDRDKRKAWRAGFDVHLTKPADPIALETLLSGSIPQSVDRAAVTA